MDRHHTRGMRRARRSVFLSASISAILVVAILDIQPASAGTLVSAISAGGFHSCALTAAGGVKCWGLNNYGQLGDGTTTDRPVPGDVSGLTSGVAAISSGLYDTCALTVAGGVKCWGLNDSGQLGDGTTTNASTPVGVLGLSSGVLAISAGSYHTCALTTAHGVKCWGDNSKGELGDGTRTNEPTAVGVTGLSSGIASISAGEFHSCAVTSSGGAKCWGYNAFGEIGDGTTSDALVPVDVSGLTTGVTAISTGGYHTCALTTAHGVKCWGDNGEGALGDGTMGDRSTPVDVSGLTAGVSAIAAGRYHTCALTIAGGAKCWGNNVRGELGDGTRATRLTPVDVSGFAKGVAALSLGQVDTCALTTAGAMQCWGYNAFGEVGDGTTVDRHTPHDVAGLPGSPRVSGFTPLSGGAGITVTITGKNLNHATRVTFNGVAASFTVASNTTITAKVPAHASTGRIKVTTPGGTATSVTNFIAAIA